MCEAWTLKEMEALGGENGDDHDGGGGGEKVVEDSLSVIINQLRNLGQSGGDESELYIQSAVPPSPYSTLPRQWSQHLPAPAEQPRCKRILTFAPDIHSQQQQQQEEEEDASCCVKAAELGLSMPCHYCVADTNSSSPEERCGEDGEDGGGVGVTTDVSYDDGWSPALASAHGSYVAGRRRHHHHNHHNHYNNNHYNHQQQQQQNHSHQRRRHGGDEEEELEAGRHHRWDAGGGDGGGGGGGGRDDVRHWNHAGPPRSWRLLEPFSTSSLEGDDSFELILREADADEMATVRAVLHKKEKRRRDDGADEGADRGAGKRRRDSGRFFCCCRRGSEPGGGDGTGGRDGGRRCWRSLGSCALALLLAPCLAYAAFAALPWSAAAPGRAAAPTTAERLAYALRCGALALLPLVLGMLAAGLALLLRQLRGGAAASTSAVRAQRAFVSDTAQQLLLHQLAALVLALNVEPHFLPLVLVTAALFVISRLVFWATIRSCYAGFGFCLSFAPSLAMLCHALYCLFTLGPAGPHGGLDDGGHGGTGARSPPTPHVPPEVQWWGS